MGAVQDDFQAVQAVGQRLQQVDDVAVLGVSETRDAAYFACQWTWLWHLQACFDCIFESIIELLASTGQELDAVVRCSVVGSGNHHAEICVQVADQECRGRGGKRACVLDVDAGSRQACLNSGREEVATDTWILRYYCHRFAPVFRLAQTQDYGCCLSEFHRQLRSQQFVCFSSDPIGPK